MSNTPQFLLDSQFCLLYFGQDVRLECKYWMDHASPIWRLCKKDSIGYIYSDIDQWSGASIYMTSAEDAAKDAQSGLGIISDCPAEFLHYFVCPVWDLYDAS